MELADHVADGARRFLRFLARGQAQLAHRVDDAPLHRLQAVGDVRQGAVQDHVHRVVEVGLLREFPQRQALDALEIQFSSFMARAFHGVTSARLPLLCSHSRRSAARFLASSMSINSCVSSPVAQRELHQPAGLGRHGGLAQLHGAHLAQALEARDLTLPFGVLGGDPVQHALRARHRRGRRTPACRHRCGTAAAWPRRHVPRRHQRGKVAQEQRAQQGGDVQAVGVGVGQDADLAVAQPRRSSEPGSTPSAMLMSCTSCEASTSAGSTSQVFRILPRSGITAWNSRSRACLAEPPAESPSTRNSSERSGSCWLQSASLPGSAGPLTTRLRTTLRLAFSRAAGVGDGQLGDALAGLRVLVQPEREARP
jgi:hypothetical protein